MVPLSWGATVVRMKEWRIHVEVDAVLRCQGGDPVTLRTRNPRLAAIARCAIAEAEHLIQARVHQLRRKVLGAGHHTLRLENGAEIASPLVARHMAGAAEVVAAIMTIGPELETYAARIVKRDPSLGLALDAAGSAAIEALSHAFCSQVEEHARDAGLHTTVPLSPGMIGWPVGQGQSQLFALWADEPLEVRLTDTSMMVPAKSLSMLIGVGSDVQNEGKPCDYCSERGTCSYAKRHE